MNKPASRPKGERMTDGTMDTASMLKQIMDTPPKDDFVAAVMDVSEAVERVYRAAVDRPVNVEGSSSANL